MFPNHIEHMAITGVLTAAGFAFIVGALWVALDARKRRKGAQAMLDRDAQLRTYEARLVAHWRSLMADMSPEDAVALLDEMMADHRRRVAEGLKVKAQARQAARVRAAGAMFKFEVPATSSTYTSEKPVFYTPEQMLKDQKEQQS